MMMQKDEENALSKLSHFEQTIKSEKENPLANAFSDVSNTHH